MKMNFTDGHDPRFHSLCRELDAYLNDQVGGEAQRRDYVQYNTPDDIARVVLLSDGVDAIACGGWKPFDSATAEIKRVYCKPAYRRKGHAQTIMEALEKDALSNNYKRLILETSRFMTPAIRFYTKLGFQVIPNYAQYRDMPQSVCLAKQIMHDT